MQHNVLYKVQEHHKGQRSGFTAALLTRLWIPEFASRSKPSIASLFLSLQEVQDLQFLLEFNIMQAWKLKKQKKKNLVLWLNLPNLVHHRCFLLCVSFLNCVVWQQPLPLIMCVSVYCRVYRDDFVPCWLTDPEGHWAQTDSSYSERYQNQARMQNCSIYSRRLLGWSSKDTSPISDSWNKLSRRSSPQTPSCTDPAPAMNPSTWTELWMNRKSSLLLDLHVS